MTNEQKQAFFMAVANHEGFRSSSYYCPAGKLTIGFGHVIRDDERKRLCSGRLTFADAFKLLKEDFDKVFRWLANQNIILQEHELFAVADLAFNVGCTTLSQRPMFRLIKQYSDCIEAYKHREADELSKTISDRFLQYVHYRRNGKIYTSDGLLLRRKFDRSLWLGDLYVLK